jgi:hypothetical protein
MIMHLKNCVIFDKSNVYRLVFVQNSFLTAVSWVTHAHLIDVLCSLNDLEILLFLYYIGNLIHKPMKNNGICQVKILHGM